MAAWPSRLRCSLTRRMAIEPSPAAEATFDRVATHVADCEHSRQAGFEQIGIAAQLFPGRRVAGLPAEVGAGDDEAVAVQLDRFSQPLRVRPGADEDEQGRGGKRPPGRRGEVFDDDLLKPPGAVPSRTALRNMIVIAGCRAIRSIRYGIPGRGADPALAQVRRLACRCRAAQGR